MTNCVDIGIDGFVLPSTILMYRYATEPPCPLIQTILALIAGVDMNGTREIAGLDMNDIRRIGQYIVKCRGFIPWNCPLYQTITNSVYIHNLSNNFLGTFHTLPFYQSQEYGGLRDFTTNVLHIWIVEVYRNPLLPILS